MRLLRILQKISTASIEEQADLRLQLLKAQEETKKTHIEKKEVF